MKASFVNYNATATFCDDYYRARDFLIKLDSHNYHFGRWDWMITHEHLDKSGLSKIGLWEAEGKVVGLATYDCRLGTAFLLTLNGYGHLKSEMILYAKDNLSKDKKINLVINDGDFEYQDIACKNGFLPTQDKEGDAVFSIDSDNWDYVLPEGFYITDMLETPDYYKYGQVLWKGFDHEANGEGAFSPTEENMAAYKMSFERPNVNKELKIAVVATNGDFVSYCGMWQDNASKSVLVEPVATDPAYRKMGLAKAAVLEAIKRCGMLGATKAFVGSSQQFYYNIGFRPFGTYTIWEC